MPIPLFLFAAGICLFIKCALQSEDLHEIKLTDYGAEANAEQSAENPFIELMYSVENENAAVHIPLSTMPQWCLDRNFDLKKLAFTKLCTKHLQYPQSLTKLPVRWAANQSTMLYLPTYLPTIIFQYSPFAGGRGNTTHSKLETISPVYMNISKINKEKTIRTTILIAIGRIPVIVTFMWCSGYVSAVYWPCTEHHRSSM